MKTALLFVVALVVIQLPNEGNAVCCPGKGLLWARKCADCSKATPYCSRSGKCNIFGCNCDGGCKTGPCPHHGHHPSIPQEPVPYGGGSYGSYDSKPEEPYYSEVASTYGSYGKPEVPAVVSEDTDTQVVEESMDTLGQESESMQSTDTFGQESENMQSQDMLGQESESMQSTDTFGQESESMQSQDMLGQESENMQSQEMFGQESENMQSQDMLGQESENMQSQDMFGQESQTDDSTYGYGQYSQKEESADMTQQEQVQELVQKREQNWEPDFSTPEALIQSADENGDGLMDIDEAEKFLVKRGLVPYYGGRVKRSLLDFDRNNDNYISADEIEQLEDKLL